MESINVVDKLGNEKKEMETPEMIRMNTVKSGKRALTRSKFGTYLMK